MLGIISATDTETRVLKESMTEFKEENVKDISFFKGKLYGRDIIFVQSGIGKVNAAITATLLIYKYNVDRIIFLGVAGSLSDKLEIGDIVIGTDVIQHDVDVSEFGYKIGQIPGIKEWALFSDEDMIEKTKKAVSEKYRLFFGRILTGDQFISGKQEKITLGKDFEALCVDMESGAVAQVCRRFGVKFLIIRSISDSITDESVMEYKKFSELAANNSKDLLRQILI